MCIVLCSREHSLRFLLFCLFLAYPSVSARALSVFICTGEYSMHALLIDEAACAEVEGERYLSADMSLVCGNDKWNFYSNFATAGIAIYTIVSSG